MGNRFVRQSLLGSLLLGLVCLLSTSVYAEVPDLIRYQGQAVDSRGIPLEGPYSLTFRLYDAEIAGTKLWQETQANVPLNGGHFSVLLGQVTPLNVDWAQARWLSVQINADPELAPRQRMTSVPLALLAKKLDGPIHISGNDVGIGITSPATKLHVVGSDVPGTGLIKVQSNAANSDPRTARITFHDQERMRFEVGWTNNHAFLSMNECRLFIAGGPVGIGTHDPQYALDVAGDVQAKAFHVRDLFFKKNNQPLWRMYEDEKGLYLESQLTKKHYRLTMEEVPSP